MIHLWILLSLFISSLALATPDSGVSPKNDEPDTVRTVDLQRYVGVWHELARLPNLFQEQCVSAEPLTVPWMRRAAWRV